MPHSRVTTAEGSKPSVHPPGLTARENRPGGAQWVKPKVRNLGPGVELRTPPGQPRDPKNYKKN
jgi:hypothetical protein